MSAGLGLIPLVGSKKGKNDPKLSQERQDTGERSSGCTNDDDTNSQHNDYFETDDSLIQISVSSVSPVVIGRSQLLKSFRVACIREGANSRSKESYRETLQWGEKALSRKLLRFSNVGLQTRGKYVAIRINGKAISSNLPENQDGWSVTSVKIKVGDILSFQPIGGQGLLEFRIVRVISSASVEQDWAIAKNNRMANHSLKRKRTMPESTGPKIIDLTDNSEHGGIKKRAKRDSNLPRHVTLDDEKPLNTTNDPSTTNSSKTGSPSYIIHFFPFGNGFSASRRQKLELNLKKLGATIVDDMLKAKYVVISESIRSLAIVAKRIRVQEENLIQHFQNNVDVRCILPSWADHCISSAKRLVIPSRVYAWCHCPGLTSPSKTPSTPKTPSPSNSSLNQSREEAGENGKQAIAQMLNREKKTIINDDDSIQTRKKSFPRNVQAAEAFKTLSNLHQSMSLLPTDSWKSYCFRIVAGRLLELDFEISNDEETQRKLKSIKGFGKSVCEKIQECIDYGTISRIQEFQSDPQRQAMKNLKDIWGVGTVRATDLMDRGYRTINDVRHGIRQGRLSLERNQLVGVDCYEDILDRMTRSEVEAIGEIVRAVAERLFPGIETSIMGSYRRGKESCGDVDIQLTHPNYVENIPTDALGRIIDELWKEGNISMHLTFLIGMTSGRHYTHYYKASRHIPVQAWERTKIYSKPSEYKFYMGCFNSPVHPPRRRRVDIKFYPYRERAFATLYFTGNGYFNRSMRLWATRVFHLKLSDQGLFSRDGNVREKFEPSSEREIFDRLKLVYREPHERQYWDALEPINDDVMPDLTLNKSELDHDRNTNQWVE